MLHHPLAEHVVARITGQSAQIMLYQDKRESETAPLPFSLSALQIGAAKRFGISAQQVLDTCQRLYETHQLITYPRSDCRYLPEEHFAGCQTVLAAIAGGVAEGGIRCFANGGPVVARETQPPRPFTDASLLSAMTGIARFVQDDKALKKILRATDDGLGTEALRAGIIELLFKRGFLFKQGRYYIHASDTGRGLIHARPSDMTAQWESSLTQISEKQYCYQDLM